MKVVFAPRSYLYYLYIFQTVHRPDVVEMHDVTAPDPKLLVYLKVSVETSTNSNVKPDETITSDRLLKFTRPVLNSCLYSASRHVYLANFVLLCRLVAILSQSLDIGVSKENFCRFG